MDDDGNRPGWAWNELALWILILVTAVTVVWFVAPVIIRPPAGRHLNRTQNACIANLKQIDGAKLTWALEFKKQTNDVPADADLFGETNYIRTKPECPQGGKYTIGPVGVKPVCTISGHAIPRRIE